MTDPITDMLNRIKSAQAVGKTDVLIPFSKIKNEIATILSKQGFFNEVKNISKGKQNIIKISLKYNDGAPAVSGAKRVSKPGQRIYQQVLEIKKIRGGYGTSIISTSKGLMTGKEAKKAKLGGEVLLEIW